jgi:hypothetical protein
MGIRKHDILPKIEALRKPKKGEKDELLSSKA